MRTRRRRRSLSTSPCRTCRPLEPRPGVRELLQEPFLSPPLSTPLPHHPPGPLPPRQSTPLLLLQDSSELTHRPTPASTRLVSTASILLPRELLTHHLTNLREVLHHPPREVRVGPSTTVTIPSRDTMAAILQLDLVSRVLSTEVTVVPRLLELVPLPPTLLTTSLLLLTQTTARSEVTPRASKDHLICK